MSTAAVLHASLDLPSAWVARFAPLIPPGETLDLACGGGRHARLLSSLGHSVLAVDRDAEALARVRGVGISTLQIDLEDDGGQQSPWPFEVGRFAGIVVTNYLHRPLFHGMFDSLAPGGVLVYETFAAGNERFGKPTNPHFLLQPGELLDFVRDVGFPLRVIAFEDGYIDEPRLAMVQRICVRKDGGDTSAQALRLD